MRFSFLDHFKQHRILGGALVLAVTQFGASVAGLLRDRILAGTFPDLNVVDVYIAAFRPSDLFFQMCIMAGYSVALVPLLAQYRVGEKPGEMHRLLSGVVGAASVFFGIVAILAAVALPWIAPSIVQFEGATLDLYVDFARIALVTNFLFVFGNAFGQYLITIQRYWIYGITPILYTVGTICGTIFLTPSFGAYGPMLGTLGGAIAYVLLRIVAVVADGYRPTLALWHPDLKEIGVLMFPRMLALGALQLQFLLYDTIASGLATGAVTINAYARNFQSVAVGVAGIALAQSAFSLLSQAAAKRETQRFWIYLRKGIIILLLITIPGAVALVLLSSVAAMLVNLTHVLATFTICITIYAISIPFESCNHLLLRAFYATKHSALPAVFSVVNGAVAIASAWYFSPIFGVFSLAVGFTVGQVIELIGLAILLPGRVRMLKGGKWTLFRRKKLAVDEAEVAQETYNP